jgi:iron(III) transport system substrate-binding protein
MTGSRPLTGSGAMTAARPPRHLGGPMLGTVPRLLAATATLSLVAACGGAPTAPASGGEADAGSDIVAAAQRAYDEINSLTGAEREQTLRAKAEEEGELSIYTSNTDMEALVEGFSDVYDIDVSIYRGNSESVLQRVLQEQEAAYYGNDIWEDNTTNLNVANEEGLLATYESEFRDRVRDAGQQENWTANRFTVFVVGWNTDLVGPDEYPRSFEELAEPQWEGKVSMEIGDFDWFAAMYQYYQEQGKSDEEIEELFRAVAGNSQLVKGHTTQGELLGAGQFAVAPSIYSHTVDKAADKGAPVAWRAESGAAVEPVIARPNGAGLMTTAAHPYAAALFMDYMLGPEGQAIISDGFRVGSVGDPQNDPLEGLEVITLPEQELLENGKKWDELYQSMLDGRPSAN